MKLDKKYGTNLIEGGSGNWVKDMGMKFVWLKEKRDILELRSKLSTASNTISVLMLAAMGFVIILVHEKAILTYNRKSNRLAESITTRRVQAVLCLLDESKKATDDSVAQLKLIVEDIQQQSKTSNLILSHVRSSSI